MRIYIKSVADMVLSAANLTKTRDFMSILMFVKWIIDAKQMEHSIQTLSQSLLEFYEYDMN
jgi:hypothetical protein